MHKRCYLRLTRKSKHERNLYSFPFPFHFNYFFLILFQTFFQKCLGFLFIVRVHLTVTFSAGSHSLNFSGQPLYFTNTNFLPFTVYFPNTFPTIFNKHFQFLVKVNKCDILAIHDSFPVIHLQQQSCLAYRCPMEYTDHYHTS